MARDGDDNARLEKKPTIPRVGRPRMKQDVERTCGKVTDFQRPRVERTVNDENEYGDANPQKTFMLAVRLRAENNPSANSLLRRDDRPYALRTRFTACASAAG